jgi:hypothetical protein
MNLSPRSGPMNFSMDRNVANSGKTRMRQQQNKFEVHVLGRRQVLAFAVR